MTPSAQPGQFHAGHCPAIHLPCPLLDAALPILFSAAACHAPLRLPHAVQAALSAGASARQVHRNRQPAPRHAAGSARAAPPRRRPAAHALHEPAVAVGHSHGAKHAQRHAPPRPAPAQPAARRGQLQQPARLRGVRPRKARLAQPGARHGSREAWQAVVVCCCCCWLCACLYAGVLRQPCGQHCAAGRRGADVGHGGVDGAGCCRVLQQAAVGCGHGCCVSRAVCGHHHVCCWRHCARQEGRWVCQPRRVQVAEQHVEAPRQQQRASLQLGPGRRLQARSSSSSRPLKS